MGVEEFSSGDDSFGAESSVQWMATDTRSPEAIQNYATDQVAAPMAEALEQSGLSVTSPRERATLAGSQLVGLAMIRYVLRLEPIASASIDHLVEVVGPTIQRYLTGDLGIGPDDDGALWDGGSRT